MERRSDCCNAEILKHDDEIIPEFWECARCGNCLYDASDPTPPTSTEVEPVGYEKGKSVTDCTEVEEILITFAEGWSDLALRTGNRTIAKDKFKYMSHTVTATQGITHLIQQAELRGAMREVDVIYIGNYQSNPYKLDEYLKDRKADLQSQIDAIDNGQGGDEG